MTAEKQQYINGMNALAETEYRERPVRRKFSNEYKRRILKEAAEGHSQNLGGMFPQEGESG